MPSKFNRYYEFLPLIRNNDEIGKIDYMSGFSLELSNYSQMSFDQSLKLIYPDLLQISPH